MKENHIHRALSHTPRESDVATQMCTLGKHYIMPAGMAKGKAASWGKYAQVKWGKDSIRNSVPYPETLNLHF